MTNKRNPRPEEAAIIAAAPVAGDFSKRELERRYAYMLLTRAEVATLDEMVAATCWKPHTTRAALTRLKARGHTITSVKVEGILTYLPADAVTIDAKL